MMADPNAQEVWSWLDSIWGFGGGVIVAVLSMLGWVNPRLKETKELIGTCAENAHRENDQLAVEIHSRINSVEKLLIILQENNREYMRLYSTVRDEQKTLSAAILEQGKILYQIRGALKLRDLDE